MCENNFNLLDNDLKFEQFNVNICLRTDSNSSSRLEWKFLWCEKRRVLFKALAEAQCSMGEEVKMRRTNWIT